MATERAYLLGLDCGNTVIKAVLFNTEGRQIAYHAIDGHSSHPAPGQVERDLNELWKNGCEAIRTVLAVSGVDPRAIAGIGCAGHGNGLYLLDKESRPLIGIQSLDNRATALSASINAENGEALQKLCLQRPWPAQTPSLLAWVKANAPETYARAGTSLFCKDFINFKLTGRLASDVSDLSGAGLLTLPENTISRELLELYGLGDASALFPDVVDPCEIVGSVNAAAALETGLAEGTPVIGGFFDVVSSAMGSGVCRPGEASIIVGTWSINQVFADSPSSNPDIFMVTTFGKDRYVNIELSATSAANLEWYVHNIIGGHHPSAFERCNEAVATVSPRRDDPFFHPYLFGSRLSGEFRGGFYGLAGWHKEGHVLRSLFEGVAFEHKRHIEVLKGAGIPLHNAVMSGGGSRSPYWPQIMSDVLALPIHVAEAQETGALGAAIGVGFAAGIFSSIEDGVSKMTRLDRSYSPDPALKDHYEWRYRMFGELTARMRGFWSELTTS